MKIDRIDIHHVAMPLIYPFRTAFGDTTSIESVLVRMRSDELVGWGEASPWGSPAFSPEWAAGAFALVRDHLGPLVIGRDVRSGEELQRLLRPVKGNPFAKASLDLAWWDLRAQELGQPLWRVIGGTGDTVEVGADLGVMDSLEELLEKIACAQTCGFKRTKLKYRPGWEVNMVSAVREAFPEMAMHVDCNSAYSLDDVDMFRELDRYNLAMIEQPLAHDDLLDHAQLSKQIETPICLDESIISVSKARQAIAIRACEWVNIKVGRVGGLTNALAIHDVCQEAGMPCWVGGMLESAVGQSHSLALATLPNIRYPSDIFPTNRFYEEDLAEPRMELSGPSRVEASARPGIGCRPNSERLKRSLIASAVIKPG